MADFTRDGDTISVTMPPDDEGFIGRECPNEDCLGYFKVKPGTGLDEEDLPCHCPYCGFVSDYGKFFTEDQVNYAMSVARGILADEVNRMLKKAERKPKRGELFGISIEVETESHPIQYYAEKELEQDLVCDECSLHYAIYGRFGYCPDCAVHNSWQIFQANRDVTSDMLELTADARPELASRLVENALEDAVSTFDSYGRALCDANADRASDPDRVKYLKFQRLEGAADKLRKQFGIDLTAPLDDGEWSRLKIGFEKRHLLAHKLGVIDERYVEETGSDPGMVGRQVGLDAEEVEDVFELLGRVAEHLHSSLSGSD